MKQVDMYTVMIASPSDIPEVREAVKESLQAWNNANSRNRNIILLPLLWENSSVPLMGDDAQQIINSQLVDGADIVVALFGHRMGQQTPRALSGTAEEIMRAHSAGKPVHPYFYEQEIPHDADLDQVKKVRDFKNDINGLYTSFKNINELNYLIWQAIEHDLKPISERRDRSEQSTLSSDQPKGVDFLVQPGSERLPKTDSKGRLKYETKRWVEISNRGHTDAKEVTVEPVEGQNFFLLKNGPFTIQRGQTRKIPVLYTMATSKAEIVIRWVENGENKSFQIDID